MEKTSFFALLLGVFILTAGAFAQLNGENMTNGDDENSTNGAPAEPALISAKVRVKGVDIDPASNRGQQLLQVRETVQTKINETVNDRKKTDTHGYMVQSNVHGMLEFADLIEGPMGQQVKTIAQKMNESVDAMTVAEVKSQGRGTIMRFFFGSDRSAVATMEKEMNKTREHIEEMQEQLLELSDEKAEALIEEQLQAMEEQLDEVKGKIVREKKSKGIFGFLVRDDVADTE